MRVSESVAGGPGFEDGAVEGEAVDDRRAETWVGESLRSAAQGRVGRDRDRGFLFPFGEDLEQQYGTAAVEFHGAEFVDAGWVDAPVTANDAGELLLAG